MQQQFDIFIWLFSHIVLMTSTTDRHRKPLSGFQVAVARPLDGTEPAEVTVEVARGHAFKTAHPVLEAAVVGVHVLHMPGSIDADTGGQVHRVMSHPDVLSCCSQRLAAVGCRG